MRKLVVYTVVRTPRAYIFSEIIVRGADVIDESKLFKIGQIMLISARASGSSEPFLVHEDGEWVFVVCNPWVTYMQEDICTDAGCYRKLIDNYEEWDHTHFPTRMSYAYLLNKFGPVIRCGPTLNH